MQIDRYEMKKNTVKSDFKKSSPINGKNKIKKGAVRCTGYKLVNFNIPREIFIKGTWLLLLQIYI